LNKKQEALVKVVLDKYQSSVDYRTDIGFKAKIDTWQGYYNGTSKETEARAAKGRSSVLPPWSAVEVEYMLSRLLLSCFSTKPYFAVYPLNTDAMKCYKLAQALLEWQCDRPTVVYQLTRFALSVFSLGLGALKTSWDFSSNDAKLTNWDISMFHYPPECEDPTDLKWCIFESYEYYNDLVEQNKDFEKRFQRPLFDNMKDLAALKSEPEEGLKTYAKEKPIHIMEYWDKSRKIVVAGKSVCILDLENPVGFVPAIVCSEVPKLSGILGIGEIEAVGDYVRQYATVMNQRNDNVTQSLIPVWIQNADAEVLNEDELENLRPGLRIKISAPLGVSLDTLLRPMLPPFVVRDAYLEMEGLERNIHDRRCHYDYARGAPPQQRETARGILSLQSAGSIVSRSILLLVMRTAFVMVPMHILAWDQRFLESKVITSVAEAQEGAIPSFRAVYRGDIQGDFKFIEMVTAVDSEAAEEVKRTQLLQALQIVAAIQERLPNVDIGLLVEKIFETFRVPGLGAVFKKAPTQATLPLFLGGGE